MYVYNFDRGLAVRRSARVVGRKVARVGCSQWPAQDPGRLRTQPVPSLWSLRCAFGSVVRWGLLLVSLCAAMTMTRAEPVEVATPNELLNAAEDGATHILITEHLDLRSWRQNSTLYANQSTEGVLPDTIRSIQVRCALPPCVHTRQRPRWYATLLTYQTR
jgi:hypothetical protein